jgi:molybdate transport system permease protein
MDWPALSLSLRLGVLSVLALLPIGIVLGRLLAWRHFLIKPLIEAALALPLVLPPTVLGFYLLSAFGGGSSFGRAYESLFGHTLVFNFHGLLVASMVANIPFAVQPMQRAFASIPPEVREAAACSGLSSWQTLWKIDIPLAWPGIVTALVLIFAHTLGEFGVVLMVGGNIPGETKTIAISIYDKVQAFDDHAAGIMSGALLGLSLLMLAVIFAVSNRVGRRYD